MYQSMSIRSVAQSVAPSIVRTFVSLVKANLPRFAKIAMPVYIVTRCGYSIVKEEGCRQATSDAPVLADFLCEPCRQHFAQVQALLHYEKVKFSVNPRLVRGLDYYCRTSFEILALGLGSQNTVCGGGRYDGLVEQMGGPAIPGIGFAIGVERLVMLLQAQERKVATVPDVFIAPMGEVAESQAFAVARRLRQGGYRVELESGSRSLKAQMRRADKLAAPYVLIVGENEIKAGKGTIRDMETKVDRSLAVDLSASVQDLIHAIRDPNSQANSSQPSVYRGQRARIQT